MTELRNHRYRPPLGDERLRRDVPEHVPTIGDVLEVDTFAGTVTAIAAATVTLEDRRGRARHFALDGQLAWLHDRAVSLVAPAPTVSRTDPGETRSGSVPVANASPRVARASRIWVEGRHDAELLELVWGDDLRHEGVVVESLGGIDDLAAAVAAFSPAPSRRLGVLVDHLVPGSKEHRIAEQVVDDHVLVAGHPFVDVWAAIDPAVLGHDAWPSVPMDEPWKQGVCDRLGYPDAPTLWRELRGGVRGWKDLDRSLVHAVERLLDHVTV